MIIDVWGQAPTPRLAQARWLELGAEQTRRFLSGIAQEVFGLTT